MWPFPKKKSDASTTSGTLFFSNTLSGKKEAFIPIKPGFATMYSCGPTVYSRAHIGNMRAYVFADLVARTLRSSGYHLRHVINITDVGHLTGDSKGDPSIGEDKMEKSAHEQGLRASDIANRYTDLFIEDIKLLNLDTAHILFPRATEYINEQIKMVQELEKKGYTYRTHDGIYYDTSKFADYGKLGGLSDAELKAGDAASLEERINVAAHHRIAENKEKRNPADFALWKFSPPGARRQQEWSSPWGLGFPGWHIECSAMIRALLGTEIDIHTGGIDHIAIHHNNEIAQSEGVFEHPFVRYWMHVAFLNIGGEKVSKSLKNDFYVSDVTERGMHPLALRYFFLQAHYRSPLSFSWDAIAASNEALHRLWKLSAAIHLSAKGVSVSTPAENKMLMLLQDDVGTPQALAYLWEVLRDDEFTAKEKLGVLKVAEPILGLSLMNPPEQARQLTLKELPEDLQSVAAAREKARLSRDFEKADTLREKLATRGYRVEDSPEGPIFTMLPNSAGK